MSAADSEAVVDRLVEKRRELGPEDFAAYALLVLSMFGWNAPDALTFLLDRADSEVVVDLLDLANGAAS